MVDTVEITQDDPGFSCDPLLEDCSSFEDPATTNSTETVIDEIPDEQNEELPDSFDDIY